MRAQATRTLARPVWLVFFVSAIAQAAGDAPATGYATAVGDAVNAYRTGNDLRPLQLDPALSAIAREHSAAMARAGKMSHDGFPDRAKRSGMPVCVENVGWNFPTPQAQFEAWRASPGHDRNMRDPRVQRIGVGEVSGYATLIACGP